MRDEIDGIIEFHQFHRKGAKNSKRGVIHVIVNVYKRQVGIGWSLCNTGRNDVFDAETGRNIARRRAEKALDKLDNPRYLEVSKPNSWIVDWELYGVNSFPISMLQSFQNVTKRISRVITAVSKRDNEDQEVPQVESDPSPRFVGDDDHAKDRGNPIF